MAEQATTEQGCCISYESLMMVSPAGASAAGSGRAIADVWKTEVHREERGEQSQS